MMLTAILRLLNNRCPACFKVVGPGAIRHGRRLYCSADHLEKHRRRGDLANPVFDPPERGRPGA